MYFMQILGQEDVVCYLGLGMKYLPTLEAIFPRVECCNPYCGLGVYFPVTCTINLLIRKYLKMRYCSNKTEEKNFPRGNMISCLASFVSYRPVFKI
jgi:hypothetical protein